MMGAAPALAAARPARTLPPERRLSTKMRIALGFLHTGALYREPSNVWRCRAFPQQTVRDKTVRALEAMGLASLAEYVGTHDVRRAAMTLTPQGKALYRRIGGRFADKNPPPLQVEGLLRENELAMAQMAADEARISRVTAAIQAETLATRAAARRIEQTLAALQAKADRFEAERRQIASNRQALGAFTQQAAERIGAAIAEAGA